LSHVVSVNIVIKDLAALEQACRELGLQFKRDQKTHKWWGRWENDFSRQDAAYIQSGIKTEDYGKCEHAIGVPDSGYEIGVYKNPKGTGYVLAYDNFGTGQIILQKLGAGLEKLKQGYAVAKATMAAKAQGWMVSRQTLKNGTIKLSMFGV
jgi:hypothetical protein